MSTIEVACAPTDDGWRCEARVDDGRTAGRHVVTVRRADAARLLGGRAPVDDRDVEGLVRATFGFLLEREPQSSILASFDITVVARYFPEYETEIRRRRRG